MACLIILSGDDPSTLYNQQWLVGWLKASHAPNGWLVGWMKRVEEAKRTSLSSIAFTLFVPYIPLACNAFSIERGLPLHPISNSQTLKRRKGRKEVA